ncbi:hypothetical protein DCS_07099 [Drechmeria coniospora]|uniref:Uncharacterized protein n=1 Tax=Drechmeria coniospora TaxID=98403 RepID=A0A151GDG2_DRECN|nr:hypothetical protein DCS_07099 [Drechmeria coniospora]KYK55137.1 hypothetical protein DCS_07099 [Drechmeria coniospora]
MARKGCCWSASSSLAVKLAAAAVAGIEQAFHRQLYLPFPCSFCNFFASENCRGSTGRAAVGTWDKITADGLCATGRQKDESAAGLKRFVESRGHDDTVNEPDEGVIASLTPSCVPMDDKLSSPPLLEVSPAYTSSIHEHVPVHFAVLDNENLPAGYPGRSRRRIDISCSFASLGLAQVRYPTNGGNGLGL